ncbi:MAG TPA: hypothetical protein VG245_00895 [Candidatus Dormibacteraeota bacterium]|jgi:hypothetical protein|nr:hypothetical protein [Candidatus Dormibacteraeota bacterium]
MNSSIRWRVMLLQGIAILVLAGAAGVLYGAGSFSQNMIRDQLVAQKVSFPPQSTVVAGGALDPAEFADITQYAGQAVDNGEKAQAYANGFIGRHLQKIAGGLTYSQVSAKAIANPTDAKLAGQVQTLFRGETLRGLLLNAYGWWTVGTYALYGALGVAVAALAVLGAFAFELGEAWRERRVAVRNGGRVGAQAPA